MLSAHQPYERFPPLIKKAAHEAGGVPAMCDGITQGRAGMELSLFSRDVTAMSTAIALSHDMFEAALFLGICDKIVPGLVIAAQAFGHLPAVFIPAGPMPSGLGELNSDLVAMVRFQGAKANGMPELHKLTPVLASVMARGHQVALVTHGRMSGASGKVPAAIHVTPPLPGCETAIS